MAKLQRWATVWAVGWRKMRMPLTLWTGFRTCQLEMGMRLRILWFPHILLQTSLPLTPALLCLPRRAGVSTEQGGAGEWSEVKYAEIRMPFAHLNSTQFKVKLG